MTRTGIGIDSHRFEAGRRLVLGGVEIPFELGLAGHSDADVLAHAIAEALRGGPARGGQRHENTQTNEGWGVAHSLQASAWGFVVWWPFLIMSMLYIVWRQRGFWVAIAIPAAVHMMQNAGPAYQVAYQA